MEIQDLHLIYHDCIGKLNNHRLKEALQLLDCLVFQSSEWSLNQEKEDLEQSYNMLLNFMEQGAEDKEKENLFESFIRRAYELADKAYRQAVKAKNASGYFETLRNRETLSPNLSFTSISKNLDDNEKNLLMLNMEKESPRRNQVQEKLIKEYTELYPQLFNIVWTDNIWTKQNKEEVEAFFKSDYTNLNVLSLIVSAMTLSCLCFFDIRKTMLLFELSEMDSKSAVTQRAFIGAILIVLTYKDRLGIYKELESYIKLRSDDTDFSSSLSELQLQLMMTMETKTIAKKMREDIIPSMIKSSQFRNNKFGFTGVDDILSKNEINPDWENNNEIKEIEQKIAKLAELQANGADVYMGTFSSLKSYPFFYMTANWLYPFDKQHPDVSQLFIGKDSFFKAFIQSNALCDSDCYSFCMMAKMIPQSQQDMLLSQMNQMAEAKEMNFVDMIKQNSVSSASLRRLYLQDLYRFFSLCKQAEGIKNPFKENMLLADIPAFDTIFMNSEQLYKLIAFSFKQNNYGITLHLYKKLETLANLSAEDYQKIGFCYQKENDYENAITYYKRADVIKSNSQWTLSHLAQCYRIVEDYENAEKIYSQLSDINPDNLQTLFRHGECLVHMQRYEESFPIFFKVEYLDKHPEKAQRAIAWCSFLTGKLEQAETYYLKLIEGENTSDEDFLNAGHVFWAQRKVPKAATYYRKFISAIGKEHFNDSYFMDDFCVLSKYGITKNEVCMMMDILS